MSLSLYLVRHAKSAWDDPELEDFERPLNARGRRDAPRMAQFAADLCGDRPPVLLSSPAVRAVTTARRFAEAMRIDPRRMHLDARLYEATAGDWLQIVREQPADAESLMAFGHNPGISEFAGWLCDALRGYEFSTAELVALRLDAPSWAALTPGCGRCERRQKPKALPEA
ncbi:SixA phosphatase family protein [Algiphilus sp.]|uniref:SixA phosphatase family protein n=1 Tax=Algiphilus sp. TaxID=1872431 RepID=UPI0025C1D7E3|nr:histidine phosphatase family protein [Algiphilus sp.]MCK5770802.1 histidine phosphatase family protein [Algiphilus sp.]